MTSGLAPRRFSKHGTLFEHYPTMTKESKAASDHAAIYADIAGL